jgi:hypothetical protein
MELLNHFVAARLMKDAQLFERIGRYDATRPQFSRPADSAAPADLASNSPEDTADESVRTARDDRRVVSPAECPHDAR